MSNFWGALQRYRAFFYWYFYAYAAKQVYFLRCRANSRRCVRRCLAFGYVARCCSRRNARLSCGADNGGRNTFQHTISPFTPFNSVLLRSGAFRFLKPNCVAWLLSNNRKRLLHTSFKVLQQPAPLSPFQDIMRDTRGLSFFMSKNKKWFAS